MRSSQSKSNEYCLPEQGRPEWSKGVLCGIPRGTNPSSLIHTYTSAGPISMRPGVMIEYMSRNNVCSIFIQTQRKLQLVEDVWSTCRSGRRRKSHRKHKFSEYRLLYLSRSLWILSLHVFIYIYITHTRERNGGLLSRYLYL